MDKVSRNKTLTIHEDEVVSLRKQIIEIDRLPDMTSIENCIIHGNLIEAAEQLPDAFVDLLFLDPPYNLKKKFISETFSKTSVDEYSDYLDSWLSKLLRLLKPTASVYICGDYHSSTSIHLVAQKYFTIQNRITWQREKGRGAKSNWKNGSEDIWFCTKSDKYKFYVDRVKEKRKVIAPYKENGIPKDWEETVDGNFRLTYPSNIWTDLTIPFWSMPENTEHPTQKPEKLLAKIILSATDAGDMVMDPFLGSGTTAVVAKKLGRKYLGIEMEEQYCLFAVKRLNMANTDKTIQGYSDGTFWERNTLGIQGKKSKLHNTLDIFPEH